MRRKQSTNEPHKSKKGTCPNGQVPILIMYEYLFTPLQQPVQLQDVRLAHGMENMIHSSDLPCGRT